ncbi:hypothetical protein [Burkholderia gladioli]|nr:hypothetical protein [Burkholderia gladioli]
MLSQGSVSLIRNLGGGWQWDDAHETQLGSSAQARPANTASTGVD